MATFLAVFEWAIWVRYGIWGLVGLFFVVFLLLVPLLMFLIALLEKRHLRPLVPVEPGQDTKMPRASTDARDAALNAGFLDAGFFTDSGKKRNKGFIALLLSQQQDVLVLIQWGAGIARFQLISHFEDGGELVTSNALNEPDLTGQREDLVHHNAKLPDALNDHYERIACCGQVPVSLDAQSLPEQLLKLQREHVDRLILLGLAKNLSEPARWRHTPKRAAHMST